MAAFPTGMAARLPVAPLLASPATRETTPRLRALPSPTSSREGNGDPSAGHSEPLTAAQTDKLLMDVLTRHTQKFEAVEAFDDLNHGLLLARERGDEVPCVGPGAEAWTSEEAVDQELAADLCLLCPVFALCQRYADVAQPDGGTWAGITRGPSAKERRRASATPRPPRPSRLLESLSGCLCGCGGSPRTSRYLPGHDSRHLSDLRAAVREGALGFSDALDELAHSEKLQAKLTAHLGR